MAKLEILRYPDPRLRIRAATVEIFDESLATLARDMLETMYAAPGIGLAATQVDKHQRLIVIDVSENKDDPLTLINPELLAKDGSEEMDEGCLSVPDIYETVERAERIRIRAAKLNGTSFEMDADGLLAVCIQHEMDHLEGKLFVDYLSLLKRSRIKKRLEKERRATDRSL
jgi:peptide deformylase